MTASPASGSQARIGSVDGYSLNLWRLDGVGPIIWSLGYFDN